MTAMTDKATDPEARWRQVLTPEEFSVLRLGGTEPPGQGEYTDTTTPGVYVCRACGAELFRSTEKFDARCGWPAFYSPSQTDAVVERDDYSTGTKRTEVRCASCDSHLGHVFAGEGFSTPTDLRYCINSICLRLDPEDPGDGA